MAGVKFRAIERLRERITEAAGARVEGVEELTDEASVARIWRERR